MRYQDRRRSGETDVAWRQNDSPWEQSSPDPLRLNRNAPAPGCTNFKMRYDAAAAAATQPLPPPPPLAGSSRLVAVVEEGGGGTEVLPGAARCAPQMRGARPCRRWLLGVPRAPPPPAMRSARDVRGTCRGGGLPRGVRDAGAIRLLEAFDRRAACLDQSPPCDSTEMGSPHPRDVTRWTCSNAQGEASSWELVGPAPPGRSAKMELRCSSVFLLLLVLP
ncbi:unnamed protein product [Lampetra fluviatilis]